MIHYDDIFRMPRTYREIAIASISLWAGIVLILIISGVIPIYQEPNIKDTTIGTIQPWDYTIYSQYISEPCMRYCNITTNTTCESVCTVNVVKLYGDSYCNVECTDGTTFKANIIMEQGKSIPAQYIQVNESLSEGHCQLINCYGIYMGLNK